jgi:hypothetical protein
LVVLVDVLLYQCSLASVLQADEHILIVFHDLAEDLEAVVKPDFLSDLTGLNLSKHFVVFVDVHALLYRCSLAFFWQVSVAIEREHAVSVHERAVPFNKRIFVLKSFELFLALLEHLSLLGVGKLFGHTLLYRCSLLAIVVKSDPGMDEPVREGLSKRLSALDRVKLMLGNATVLIGDTNNYDVWLGGGHTLLYQCSLPAAIHRLNEDDHGCANDDTDKGSEDLFHTLLYQSSFFLRPGFFFAGSSLTFSNTSLPSLIADTLFFTCLRTGFGSSFFLSP